MDVLGLLCGDAALKTYRLDGNMLLRIPDVSEAADYLVLDPYKSDFHTCPTMGLDETTLDGTISVYQKLLEYIQVESASLDGRAIFSYGDLLTVKNLSSLKEMRIRESRADRLEFAAPKAAFFHMSMANVDAVIRCKWDKNGSRDPSSLSRFAAVLNRSGITEETGDFNARYRLIDHVLSGYVAAALMTQASKLSGYLICTPKDLTEWVKGHDWRQLVTTVVTYYFALGRVAFQRGQAIDRSTAAYETRRADILSKKKGQRTVQENQFCSNAGRKTFWTGIQSHFRTRFWRMRSCS